LEKQIHDDEEFAKTLALLDEAPLTKKVGELQCKHVYSLS